MFCSGCGKEVSDQAQTCPNCGQPFKKGSSSKSKTTALLLCIFLMGFHRFYVGKIGTGILFLCTAGGIGIWWIIDLINICRGTFEDSHGLKLDD